MPVPTYVYACKTCGHQFEQYQSFSDDALTVCPQCEGALRKVFNSVGIVFKGTGFYSTDKGSAPAKSGAPSTAAEPAAASASAEPASAGTASSTAGAPSAASASSAASSGSATASESAA